MYENAYKSRYEELRAYYPVWYRDVLEMDTIWKAMGSQFDGMQRDLVHSLNNCFVGLADLQTIEKWEQFLWIPRRPNRTLEERRALIKSFFLGTGHVGEREIKEIIGEFTNGEVFVALNGGVIKISVLREVTERTNFADSAFFLRKRLPAHLALSFREEQVPIACPVLPKTASQLIMETAFYPRRNIPPLFWNGAGFWDGRYFFHGLLVDSTVDFYPMNLFLSMGIGVNPSCGVSNQTGSRFFVPVKAQGTTFFAAGYAFAQSVISSEMELFQGVPAVVGAKLSLECTATRFAVPVKFRGTAFSAAGYALAQAAVSSGMELLQGVPAAVGAKLSLDRITTRFAVPVTARGESFLAAGGAPAPIALQNHMKARGLVPADTKLTLSLHPLTSHVAAPAKTQGSASFSAVFANVPARVSENTTWHSAAALRMQTNSSLTVEKDYGLFDGKNGTWDGTNGCWDAEIWKETF